jgi:hypothetical protein
VTTDYWQERIPVPESFRAYGQSWEVASRDDIAQFLKSAAALGLSPKASCEIPACRQKTVRWGDVEYTFIAMLFRKDNGATGEQPSR